jgi:hypothetical protein
MRPDNEILIDYLDKQLSSEESAQVESVVNNNIDYKKELQYLNLAIDTVRLDSINQKVASIRQSLGEKQRVEMPAPAIVRNINKVALRIAASIVLFLLVASVYKYVSVNNQSFYNRQFTGYELSNSRGQDTHDAEAEAYQNKKWNEVISIYQEQLNKSNQQSFLAGMAEMQLKHFPNAIGLFENIMNSQSGDMAFKEEAEYNLSMSYLMNHEGKKAIDIINKIKENPNHTYYPIVSKISPIDLKIIELKNK